MIIDQHIQFGQKGIESLFSYVDLGHPLLMA